MNYKCNPCNLSFQSVILYQAHVYSSSHEINVKNIQKRGSNAVLSDECKCNSYIQKEPYGYVTCTLCRVSLNSSGQVYTHVRGEKHRKLLPGVCRSSFVTCVDKSVAACNNLFHTAQGSSIQSQSSYDECKCSTYIQKEEYGYVTCTLCRVSLNSSEQVYTHVRGEKHRKLLPGVCRSSILTCMDKAVAACKNLTHTAHVSSIQSQSLNVECKCSNCIQKSKDGYTCTLCRVSLNSPGQVFTHVAGQKHHKLLLCKCTREESVAASKYILQDKIIFQSSDTIDLSSVTPSSCHDENILSKVKFFGVNDEICF